MELSFTLHTFGYGDDHDAKLMNKLANLRDGSFFYVQDYSKVAEYFVSVLGACVSVITKKLDLKMQVLNNDCKIIKAYGAQNLYYHEMTKKYFQTAILQFICGKEYTFVLDIFVDESKVQVGDEIMKLEISYEDIEQDNKKMHKEIKYKYELKDPENIKANEEFTRAYVYYTLDEAIKLKDKQDNKAGKKKLEELEKWLSDKDKAKNEKYLKEIKDAKNLFSEHSYFNPQLYNNLNCCIQNNMFKRMDINNMNCNSIQMNMINSIPKNTNPNNNFNNKNPLNMNSAPSMMGLNPNMNFNINMNPMMYNNMNYMNNMNNMNNMNQMNNMNLMMNNNMNSMMNNMNSMMNNNMNYMNNMNSMMNNNMNQMNNMNSMMNNMNQMNNMNSMMNNSNQFSSTTDNSNIGKNN